MDLDIEFEEWWLAYPRKEGKADARKAFGLARRLTDLDVLKSSARAYGERVPKVEQGLPGGWLRGERWGEFL